MPVVAAVDRSDRAVPVVEQANALATALDEHVHVIHVMPESELTERQRGTASEQGGPVSDDEVKSIAADRARETVKVLSGEFEFVGLIGDPVDKILQYAHEENASYLVLGPRKRSPTGKALFGSIAQQVLLNSSVPVVTVLKQELVTTD